jgi:hypothetical protein
MITLTSKSCIRTTKFLLTRTLLKPIKDVYIIWSSTETNIKALQAREILQR